MLNANALRGAMAAKGYTQKRISQEMGISEQSLSNKMKAGVFKSTEIDTLIRILDLDDPMPIFFAPEVASDATPTPD